MENEILEANLKCIEIYNKPLVDKIRSMKKLENIIELTKNETGHYNLEFNGLPIHSTKNPEEEAKDVFKSISHNNLNSLHIIYGMGLGYLFEEFAENAEGRIILYEPNIDILRVALELVDFTKHLSRPDILVVNDLDSLKNAFNSKFLWKTQTNFVFLNFYKFVYEKDLNNMLEEVRYLQSMNLTNFEFDRKHLLLLMESVLNGFSEKISVPELNCLKDKFEGKPALVVSAGGSLAKNIDIIKKYRDKVVIFCVGTAYKVLAENGITPDFLNVIEMYDNSAQFEKYDLTKVNAILEPFTNIVTQSKNYKRKYFTCSGETKVNRWYANMLGLNASDYETKGTVSYQALSSAKKLGCDPIIVIGQDLAYMEGQCYSKGSPYAGLKCGKNPKTGKYEIMTDDIAKYTASLFSNETKFSESERENIAKDKIVTLNKNLSYIDGVNGEQLPTDTSYVLFAKYFGEFAISNKDVRFINSSFGAKLKGFEDIPLEQILGELTETIDVESVLANISVDAKVNTDICQKLDKEYDKLFESLPMFENGQKVLKTYKNSIAHQTAYTEEVSNAFNDCVNAFLKIYNFARAESFLLQVTTFAEEIVLGWYLKEKVEDADIETLKNFGKYFSEYFIKSYDKTKKLLERLKAVKEEAHEVCCSAC